MMSKAMEEAIATIRDFLDGRGNPWAWDDFLSVPPSDPEVVRLQGFCRKLAYDYPPQESTEFCSSAGMDRLRAEVDQLELCNDEPR